jgi:hypothetical protein
MTWEMKKKMEEGSSRGEHNEVGEEREMACFGAESWSYGNHQTEHVSQIKYLY